MGHSRPRTGRDSKRRYTAYFEDIRGTRQSAGTFATKRDADKAWQRAETRVAEGRIGDPRRGRQTFRHYVETTWLPNHVIEATTRESYTYSIDKHLLPWFGEFKMAEILPAHVREWIVDRQAAGVSPATIRYNKILLGSVVGEGRRPRDLPFGAKTAQALDRYLRMRMRHEHANLPALWLGTHSGAMTRPASTRSSDAAPARPALPPMHLDLSGPLSIRTVGGLA